MINDHRKHTGEEDSVENRYYIDPAITIRLEGVGETDYYKEFTVRESGSGEKVTLKPGKYRLSEILPGTGDFEPSNKAQSYLKSYEFEINELGAYSATGDAEWSWLRYDKSEKIYKVFPESMATWTMQNVTEKDHVITITNYADLFYDESDVPEIHIEQ